jgi:hypothetical protein
MGIERGVRVVKEERDEDEDEDEDLAMRRSRKSTSRGRSDQSFEDYTGYEIYTTGKLLRRQCLATTRAMRIIR